MKYFFTSLLFISIHFTANGQLPSHKVWAFGVYAGLDFSTQPPTGITTSVIGWESFASQCDDQGNLLFYTNGEEIYDRQHNIFPNGDSLTGNIWGSSSQGVQIIPHPADINKYIVLSLDPNETYTQYPHTHGCLYYSVVDMTLNNGFGAIVPGQKNILVDSLFSEHMMVVGNECKMWLVTHTYDGPTFRCYPITAQGLGTTPVISSSGTSGSSFKYIRGEIAYDAARKRIFLSTPDTTYAHGVLEMHDFNINTGIVSNPQLLAHVGIYYRLCASPLSTKLYATGAIGGYCVLDQFDITLPTTADIINSKVTIHNSQNDFMQDMAVGPDSMIYGDPSSAAYFLFRIENPDAAGTACNFVWNAVSLAPGTTSVSGLPQPCAKRSTGNSQDSHYEHDTTICGNTLLLHAPDTTYTTYLWSDGSTGQSITVTGPGTYWVLALSDCKERTDTFNVYDYEFIPKVFDTVICFSGSATLKPTANLPNKLWSDGSTGNELVVTQPGTYWVYSTDFCIEAADTFKVTFTDFDMSLPGDTVVCDDIMIFTSMSVPGATYLWQDGSTTPTYTATTTGAYWVEVNKDGCKKRDTMLVDNRSLDIHLGDDALLCEGTSTTLKAGDPSATYTWQDGSSGNEYVVKTAGTYWVAGSNNTCTSADTVNVAFEKCDCLFNVPTVFTPNNDGKNDLFHPLIEATCPVTEYTLRIFNRWGEMMYSSHLKDEKWDGRYKGQLADVGVYMYHLSFKGAKGKMFSAKGDITLLR